MIFLLISAVPAVVFILFPDAASNINSGDIPSFNAVSAGDGADGMVEQQTSHYLVRLKPLAAPVQLGKEAFELEILNRNTGSHWVGLPTAQLSAPDGKQQQITSLTLKPGLQDGVFRVQATFDQPGYWQLTLNLKDPDQQVSLRLNVQS
ncbi:hypothetical protein [Vampirovibrio sp.]|uniref:hypothetical protein n=1 Tax=Vampirovibrio sp. TaxID=2717857 RepID=UPI0035938A54